MRDRLIKVTALAGAALLALAGTAGRAEAGKPNIMKGCLACHKPADGVIRGKLVSVSEKFGSLNVTVGPLVWIVKYGDDLKIKQGDKIEGLESLQGLPRDKEIAVTYTGGEDAPRAVQVAVKQPYSVPEEKLLSLEEMRTLAAQGPEQGKYTLVDSRPGTAFLEGHLPGAQSLPYPAFAKMSGAILPADKGAFVIFYCAGVT